MKKKTKIYNKTDSFKASVLIVHNYYQIPGGEDTVVVNEKKMLEDNGHKVILYSRSNSELKTLSIIEKIFLPFAIIFSIRTYCDVKKIIIEQNIDIVHVHNTWSLISPSVYYAALFYKVPVVQTIHNFRLICPGATFYREGHICEECFSKGLKCAIKYRCYRRSLAQTLACVIALSVHRLIGTYKKLNYICLTEFNKEKLLQLNAYGKKMIDEKRVYIKSNFANMDREVLSFEQRKNQFVFVGRLDKLKGIDLLLEAWKSIKDSELIICGVGPEEEWCRNFIKENNIFNVNMLGLVTNIRAIEIISESKALILPTQWYEGFPMTIVESLACGTPIIGSDIGNVGSLIKEGVNGIKFQFDSVESLKESINTLGKSDCISKVVRTSKTYSKISNYVKMLEIYESVKEG